MTLENVPWFVDQAEHGPEVARVLAYAATGGAEGVISPGDFKVTASAIPDANINIQPGAVAMLNRFPGGEAQAYIARNVGSEVQALTPQGSSGDRYDLIAVVVRDPQYPGQPAPASVPDGPYVDIAVYEGVGAGVRSLAEVDADQTGYALALVKFNASDGTVNGADITDLRRSLFSRSRTEKRMITHTTTENMSNAGYATFPNDASFTVTVPEWANKVALHAILSGVNALDDGADGGTANGNIIVELGTLATNNGIWRANAVGPGKMTTLTMQAAQDGIDVPVAMRGTTQTLRVRAYRSGGAGMTVRATDGLTAVVTADFKEEAV